MDNLYELRDSIGKIKPLKEKMESLDYLLSQSKAEVDDLLEKYTQEQKDVIEIQKSSFSAFVLKLVNQYDKKLEKEQYEEIEAKANFDQAVVRMEELSCKKKALAEKLALLDAQMQQYEAALNKRRLWMQEHLSDETSQQYHGLGNKRQDMVVQVTEIEEALEAARLASATALQALDALDSAEGWATYDVWSKSNIISHIAKYSHIDKAEDCFHRLLSQLADLRTELLDIQRPVAPELLEISPSQRSIDYWFDNIFTDISVRSQIRDNMDELQDLLSQISSIEIHLIKMRRQLNDQMKENQEQQEALLLCISSNS